MEVYGLSIGPWVLLLVGLLLAFFGRALVVLQIALLGALLGAAGGLGLLTALINAGLPPPGGLSMEVLQLIAIVLGALVGWVPACSARWRSFATSATPRPGADGGRPMSGHFIVCGMGQVGHRVVELLL